MEMSTTSNTLEIPILINCRRPLFAGVAQHRHHLGLVGRAVAIARDGLIFLAQAEGRLDELVVDVVCGPLATRGVLASNSAGDRSAKAIESLLPPWPDP